MELYGKSAYEQNKEEAEEMEELTNITKLAVELAEVSKQLDSLRNENITEVKFLKCGGILKTVLTGPMRRNLVLTAITLLEARQKELRNELAL